MAKAAKSERQKVLDDIRKQQKSAEKRRGYMIVAVCVVIALLIVGAAAFRPIKSWWELRAFKDLNLSDIGAASAVCGDITTEEATGSAEHLPTDTQITYDTAPPAFGPHWNDQTAPVDISSKFYPPDDDRPELEQLVHNLEHGYTVLWYDDTVADDDAALNELRGIAEKLDQDDDNYRNKFKAVPWTDDDGEAFPDGNHIAFTHWSVGGEDAEEGDPQEGVFQYCTEVSGEALESFMLDYPYTDSPEPAAP